MQQTSGRSVETSVQFSLKELRELESHRISEEQARKKAAEEARIRAAAEAEAAKRAADEAKRAAEHAERLRIEAARAEAARQERLQLEAAEAAERARHAAELEAIRVREELEIRRIEANKKRPKWMIAVTALALVVTAVLVVFTVKALASSEESAKKTQVAHQEARDAIAAQKQFEIEMGKMRDKLAALDTQVNDAVDSLIKATTQAEIRAANEKAKKAREAKALLERQMADARAKKEREDRLKGVTNLCVGQAVCK